MEEQRLGPYDLNGLAEFFRKNERPKYSVIYAHNGTGKTRLSMKFKDLGKQDNPQGDTLYFNAYTEDLFYWDNDLDNDTERFLMFNKNSHFFNGIYGYDIENKIAPILSEFVDFDFKIDVDSGKISFSRSVNDNSERVEHIKISRGEETIFIWCFFLAIVDLISDNVDYNWVKYIYIDDPVSSLDDDYAICIGVMLAKKLKDINNIKIVISSHHGLFFNVMYNALNRNEKTHDLKKKKCYFLNKEGPEQYFLIDTTDTPFFHHLVLIHKLNEAIESGKLYTYHFNILRTIMEKTAVFLGYDDFSKCIERFDLDEGKKALFKRMLNIFSHANYSLFSPQDMGDNNKNDFKTMFEFFKSVFIFNDERVDALDENKTIDITTNSQIRQNL